MLDLDRLARKYCPLFYEKAQQSPEEMSDLLSLMESVRDSLIDSFEQRRVSTLSARHSQVMLHCIDPMRSWGFIESTGVSFSDMLDCIVYIKPTISASSLQFGSNPNLFGKYGVILGDGIVEKSFPDAMQTKGLPQGRESRHKKFRGELINPMQELELAVDLDGFEERFSNAVDSNNWTPGINNEIFVSKPKVSALFLLESELIQNPNAGEALQKEADKRGIPFYILSSGGYFHLFRTSEMIFDVSTILESEITHPEDQEIDEIKRRLDSQLFFTV